MTAIGSFTPTYDNDGNVTNDNIHAYAWDAYGNSTTLDSVGLTFDAFDRMVEQNRSGAYTQIVYSPTGFKMQILNGQTVARNFVPLAGGGTAVYNTSALQDVRHPDWLGSSRFASTTSRTMYFDTACAPFGEPYASTGATDLNFTGMNADSTSGSNNPDYDFLYREYSTEGRWVSPDPSGLAAVDPSNPQSWNRYAYVLNNPLANIDPLGLDCVNFLNEDQTYYYVTIGDCGPGEDNGYYFPGSVTGIVTNDDGQVTGVTLDGGLDAQPVGFDYNGSSSSSSDSSADPGSLLSFIFSPSQPTYVPNDVPLNSNAQKILPSVYQNTKFLNSPKFYGCFYGASLVGGAAINAAPGAFGATKSAVQAVGTELGGAIAAGDAYQIAVAGSKAGVLLGGAYGAGYKVGQWAHAAVNYCSSY